VGCSILWYCSSAVEDDPYIYFQFVIIILCDTIDKTYAPFILKNPTATSAWQHQRWEMTIFIVKEIVITRRVDDAAHLLRGFSYLRVAHVLPLVS
jgi:hypothetical protein